MRALLRLGELRTWGCSPAWGCHIPLAAGRPSPSPALWCRGALVAGGSGGRGLWWQDAGGGTQAEQKRVAEE